MLVRISAHWAAWLFEQEIRLCVKKRQPANLTCSICASFYVLFCRSSLREHAANIVRNT
jgi:hypothetical protein